MAYWDGTCWQPETATSGAKRSGYSRRFLAATTESALIVALVFGLIAGSTFAAPGGGKGGSKHDSSSSLAVQLVSDMNEDGRLSWNDKMTFSVWTTATDKPWVRLDCYQLGTWVSTTVHGFFAAYPWPPIYTLASGAWTSGEASCVAKLYKVTSNGRSKTLATLSFVVDA